MLKTVAGPTRGVESSTKQGKLSKQEGIQYKENQIQRRGRNCTYKPRQRKCAGELDEDSEKYLML
jgi:hypothetical protein